MMSAPHESGLFEGTDKLSTPNWESQYHCQSMIVSVHIIHLKEKPEHSFTSLLFCYYLWAELAQNP